MKKHATYGDYTILITVNSGISTIYWGGIVRFLRNARMSEWSMH